MRRALPTFASAILTMGCAPAAPAGCFAPGTELPERAAVLAAPGIGESARMLVDALFANDVNEVKALLARDPALARLRLGGGADVLSLAVASCKRDVLDAAITAGAPLDGDGKGMPLILALRARDQWFAERLLKAGARANPPGAPSVPMRTAIGLNAPGAVAMLLDAGADPNLAERTGTRPMHTALDMERFRIAELLLDRGADPWAIDAGGANLATSTATPMLASDRDEAAAQRRLADRVRSLGWPQPAPDPRAIRALALEGRWPPAGKGAPVPELVLKLIRARAR